MKPTFTIYDWAGNEIETGFKSFDDAWNYLFQRFPDDDDKDENDQDLQEYHVEEAV